MRVERPRKGEGGKGEGGKGEREGGSLAEKAYYVTERTHPALLTKVECVFCRGKAGHKPRA